MNLFIIFAVLLVVVSVSNGQLGSVHCKVGCACAEDYQPVCASDRRTYANECKLRCKQCETKGLEAVFYGRCEDSILLAPASTPYNPAASAAYSAVAPVAYSPTSSIAYTAAAPVAYSPTSSIAYTAAAPVAYSPTSSIAYTAAAPVAYSSSAPTAYSPVAYAYSPYVYHSK